MLTEEALGRYLETGIATVDTPLTPEQIAAASAAFDRLLPFQEPQAGQKPRYRYAMTCSYYDRELLEIIEHPWFEETAKQVLNAESVRFFQTAITNAYPQPNTPFGYEQHVDIQYCLSDWEATPRHIICSYFLWLTDVNERRAPMMVRPGSHWLLAEANEANPERRGKQPVVQGVALENLPQLGYADPLPTTAKAGQVSVVTTATVHGASTNVDAEPRKVLVITFTAEGRAIGLSPTEERQRLEYNEELRRRLSPDRAYIVPEV